MSTARRRSALSYIGYTNNAVLQLIIALGVAYVMLAITWAIIMIVFNSADLFNTLFVPQIALPTLAHFKAHWWTIFIYGIFHVPNSFMELFSNAIWLYCFGAVVQMLIGHKQIIPLFLYSLLAGGVFYLLVQFVPGEWQRTPAYIMGPRAGMVGMAAAAVTLSPQYRFYLTETFSIHILVVAGIFGVLMLMGTGFWLPVIAMLVGGGLMGFTYVKLLKAGYRPGEWMHRVVAWTGNLFTPPNDVAWKKNSRRRNEIISNMSKSAGTQKRLDDILDKINQKGYNSLSQEEKDFLMKTSKDK